MKTIATLWSGKGNNPLIKCIYDGNTLVINPDCEKQEEALLVVDETTFVPGNTHVTSLVRGFLTKGKPVTILNPGKDQEKLMKEVCGMSNNTDNFLSCTIVPVRPSASVPVWAFLKLQNPAKTVKSNEKITGDGISNELISDHYQLILDAIDGNLEIQQGTPSYPQGLYASHQHITTNASWTIPAGSYPPGSDWNFWKQQHITLSITVDIFVFLNDPVGDTPYQQVAFVEKCAFSCGGLTQDNDNRMGWFIANCVHNQIADTSLTMAESSPQTPNNQTTVTSTIGFDVNFGAGPDGPKGGGSFNYSHSKTENIADWTLSQYFPAEGTVVWAYFQQSPFNTFTPLVYNSNAFKSIASFANHCKQPSTIASSSIDMTPQSSWSNDAAVKSMDFTSSGTGYVQHLSARNNFVKDLRTSMGCYHNSWDQAISFVNLPVNSKGYHSVDPSEFNGYMPTIMGSITSYYSEITNNTTDTLTIFYVNSEGILNNCLDNSGNNLQLGPGDRVFNSHPNLVFINDSFECVAILEISIAGSESSPLPITLDPSKLHLKASIIPISGDSKYAYSADSVTSNPIGNTFKAQIINLSSDEVTMGGFSGASLQSMQVANNIYGFDVQVGDVCSATKSENNSPNDEGYYQLTGSYAHGAPVNIYIGDLSAQPIK